MSFKYEKNILKNTKTRFYCTEQFIFRPHKANLKLRLCYFIFSSPSNSRTISTPDNVMCIITNIVFLYVYPKFSKQFQDAPTSPPIAPSGTSPSWTLSQPPPWPSNVTPSWRTTQWSFATPSVIILELCAPRVPIWQRFYSCVE